MATLYMNQLREMFEQIKCNNSKKLVSELVL